MSNGGKFYKKTVRDVPLDNKTVLVRADYNVPQNEAGEIDFWIRKNRLSYQTAA